MAIHLVGEELVEFPENVDVLGDETAAAAVVPTVPAAQVAPARPAKQLNWFDKLLNKIFPVK